MCFRLVSKVVWTKLFPCVLSQVRPSFLFPRLACLSFWVAHRFHSPLRPVKKKNPNWLCACLLACVRACGCVFQSTETQTPCNYCSRSHERTSETHDTIMAAMVVSMEDSAYISKYLSFAKQKMSMLCLVCAYLGLSFALCRILSVHTLV